MHWLSSMYFVSGDRHRELYHFLWFTSTHFFTSLFFKSSSPRHTFAGGMLQRRTFFWCKWSVSYLWLLPGLQVSPTEKPLGAFSDPMFAFSFHVFLVTEILWNKSSPSSTLFLWKPSLIPSFHPVIPIPGLLLLTAAGSGLLLGILD